MKKFVSLILLAVFLTVGAWAGDDLLTSQMVDQARAWSQKGRHDLAADVWRKLLETDRRHPEALVKLGLIEAREGNLEAAQALHQRASQLAKPPEGLKALSSLLASSPEADRVKPAARLVAPTQPAPAATPSVAVAPKPSLQAAVREEPRRATVNKEIPAAVPSAKPSASSTVPQKAAATVPSGSAPSPPVRPNTQPLTDLAKTAPAAAKPGAGASLASLQTPQAISEQWAQTRVELERLAQLHPKEPRYRIALAIHLTHRETSRREAIRQLATLAQQGLGTRESKKAWSDALVALSPRDGDRALMNQFLVRYPANTAIAQKRRSLDLGETALQVPQTPPPPAAIAPSTPRPASAEIEKSPVQESAALALAQARQMASRQQWLEGLSQLERVAPPQRTPEVVAEQRALWVKAQAAQARQLSEQGEPVRARSALEMAHKAARSDSALQAFVGAAWVDIAQPEKGLPALEKSFEIKGQNNLDDGIKLAEGLLQTRQDKELTRVLRRLSMAPQLSPAQRDRTNEIILRLTLRMAEQARDGGQFAKATDLLTPLLREATDNRAALAMAWVHRSAGKAALAVPLIDSLIAKEPADIGHRWLAAELALDLKALDKADEHLKAALKQAADHPRLLATAGRLELIRGEPAKAAVLFQKAQLQERQAKAFAGVPALMGLRLLNDAPAPVAPASPATPDTTGASLLPIPTLGQAQTPSAPTKAAVASKPDRDGFARLSAAEPGLAAESFARQLRQRPKDSLAMNNLAVAKAAMGNFDAALALLMRAQASSPERVEIRGNYELLKRWSSRKPEADSVSASRSLPPLPPLWTTGTIKKTSVEKARTLQP